MACGQGIATAGLLAHFLTAKFCDALPFYRQEGQFERLGVAIPPGDDVQMGDENDPGLRSAP